MTTPHDRAIVAAAKAIAGEGTRRFGDVATAWNRMTVSERKACLAMTEAGVSAYLAALAADAARCTHQGWTFEQDGRCCRKCGVFVVDFGD